MSATLTAVRLPAEQASSRTQTAATWLFVLPLLTEGVLPDVVKLQVAGLALLAFVTIGSGRPLPHRAIERIFLVAAVLTLTVVGYLAFSSWPQGAGTPAQYDERAVMWVVTYSLVAVFAVLFFEAEVFERVMWRGCTIALWFGVAACAVSRVTGHPLLVNPAHGTLRMDGVMSEPSAWAPVLCVVLLLALRRRSWLHVTGAAAGLVLAASPVCILVMVLTVPLYFALTTPSRRRPVVLAALAGLVFCGALFAHRADTQAWLDSGSTGKVVVGRLLSGIQDVSTDGQQGSNTRYANVTGVLDVAREGGWLRTGAGPGADAVYFRALNPSGLRVSAAANSLWASVLFDLGEWGAGVLSVLVIAAAWRLRRSPVMCALLLPFLVASMVNSAVPDWSFSGLAVVLFAFGWQVKGTSGTLPSSLLTRAAQTEPPRPSSLSRG